MGKAQRLKGHNWERQISKELREEVGMSEARRGIQYRDGSDAADSIVPCLWIECKAQKKASPRAALAQSIDANKRAGAHKWPVAVIKDDYKPPFVVMLWDDYKDLLREWWELKNQ